ncbi:MAG: phosphatase PAP2 family protein [Oscillospiraceae bacterium]|nr:phosphatase PAP2 family protein [Oscillospiraceae bacterium]
MEILYFLQSIRNPVLDAIMLTVTRLGEETAFLVLALIVFWCVDKRKGYYIMSIGFIGTVTSQFMKLACRIPRPWVLDENFTVVGDAKEAATGYSFPSGHSQSGVGTLGGIAAVTKTKWLKITCIVLAVLIPFSRMYLGVHTPADVLVGSGLALILIFALKPVIFKGGDKAMWILIGSMLALAVAFLCYVEFFPFPADMDPHNMESGVKNAYTLLGCLLGVCLVYALDSKWLNFQTDAIWWAQILKALLGLGVVLLVKEGMRAPLEWLFNGHLASRAARYFLVVVTAGTLWPLSFPWFAKLGKKEK